MRILIAPDSFKGSLDAVEVADALAAGLRRSLPDVELDLLPLADGGEGTCRRLVRATGGMLHHARVTGPLGRPVRAEWGILGLDRETAVVEMAAASGLALVPVEERDPLHTTTRGTGELLLAAASVGCQKVIVGLGGSATCDGGAGLAQALGYALLDADGKELPPGGGALLRLDRIEKPTSPDALHAHARHLLVRVACDVDNPLCGDSGAARVYGPQKGASPNDVEELEAGLRRLAVVVLRDLKRDVLTVPGAGAAGGLGAGLLAFTNASLERGVDLVLDAVGFDAWVRRAQLVITGEGCLDAQTLSGKTPFGVAQRAAQAGVPVVAVAGRVLLGDVHVKGLGFERVLQVTPEDVSEAEALARARELVEASGARIGRLVEDGTIPVRESPAR